MTTKRHWLVIPAAGIGQRMQADRPKQYLTLSDRFLLDVTLSRLLAAMNFAGCRVALHPEDAWWPRTEASRDRRVGTCAGGEERSESVLRALDTLVGEAAEDDWVLVHDVARPCLARDDLARLVTTLSDHPVGGLLACPVTDTLKQADPSGQVSATVDRSRLWRALTPQMFRYGLLRRALTDALASGAAITDEASAIEHAGGSPQLVEGRPDNLKVTLPADLALAEFVLARLARAEGR